MAGAVTVTLTLSGPSRCCQIVTKGHFLKQRANVLLQSLENPDFSRLPIHWQSDSQFTVELGFGWVLNCFVTSRCKTLFQVWSTFQPSCSQPLECSRIVWLRGGNKSTSDDLDMDTISILEFPECDIGLSILGNPTRVTLFLFLL
jgi:hypothetical protein